MRNETKVAMATLMLVVYGFTLSAASPVMSASHRKKAVENRGSIKGFGVGIYWNQQATDNVSSIDWGTFDPGTNKSGVVYIKNEGRKAVSLSFQTSNWNPSDASDYISVNWDYGRQFIDAGEIIPIIFTLSISASIEGIETFSFDITITASP